MTTTCGFKENMRLCNQIIRNTAVSFIAEKHNLQVKYSSDSKINSLGIRLYSGTNVYPTTISLTDCNFFEILDLPELNQNVNINDEYFQTNSISNKIYNYLRDTKEFVVRKNPFADRYSLNNDCFVHIRLGDVTHCNVGVEYYKKVISRLKFDTLYIASDSPKHSIVQQILQSFERVKFVHFDEIKTIQFGSTCKHVVLSHGTFSAVIGYLSFFSEVYYPHYSLAPNMWHGDIFSIPGWKCVGM